MKYQTAFTAPHFRAAEVGQKILDEGGTASEAMVAAAAMVSVQYPHMNSIGGDSFWLICHPGKTPVAIDACGAAALNADPEHYRVQGNELPASGGGAAITMGGTISGWHKALELNHREHSLQQLLQPAISAARDGIEVTQSLVNASEKTVSMLAAIPSFAQQYLPDGKVLEVGQTLCNPALAATFERLASAGLDDFYRGEIAQQAAADLAALGSPLTLEDFHRHQARVMEPLSVETSKGTLYNFGAPTQGVASLLILAIYDQLAAQADGEIDHIHLLVEATKQAFIIRDELVTDEEELSAPLQYLLTEETAVSCAEQISLTGAQPWPHIAKPGDTVWMGATDQYGTMVSFIQSVYWEFGSGAVLPNLGFVWNNRAKSFSLDATHHNVLKPGKKPFHTLNPAYAELSDGQRMVYGTMGGEGQPQTQACLFSRYVYQGYALDEAIATPRWLLGRTWGDDTHQLRLEHSLYQLHQDALRARGHDITQVKDNNELMGHAGAVVLNEQGQATCATDPRSDGQAFVGQC
ncbi:gamma-glutamyltransferase family protein [Vibrio mangrovi]|uniref:Gamma-glutamyltransferase n=1 Tax=Vibrio mangrovi TaxID=474394 RepID=A0A1Y6IX05_9VIBR|nr:gamma-glutamyltransferase [Vibrio mangrovi]MDW6005392.1 gamma-glutamyltransferase [Vibrio mangrovi]SMS02168.1 Putative gamma-glutamyltransferase YwrD [Vibrio mangrovi]